jgi:membrane associated rhomboid family serine protease
MVQAPVGWHCRQCVRKNAKKSPVIRYRPGTGTLPTLSQVPMTMGLIAICVALYIASTADPNLLNDTAMQGLAVQNGQWYRVFTSIFFHLNILHIGLNMVSLLIIGRLVEPILGRWRYLALFLVSGLGGSLAVFLFSNALQPVVGASGAIFGLFGAYFVLARRARADTSGIGVLIAINLFYSFVIPDISWQDHIGGLVAGIVLAAAFGLGRRGRGRAELVTDMLAVAGVCIVLGLLFLLPPAVMNLG